MTMCSAPSMFHYTQVCANKVYCSPMLFVYSFSKSVAVKLDRERHCMDDDVLCSFYVSLYTE